MVTLSKKPHRKIHQKLTFYLPLQQVSKDHEACWIVPSPLLPFPLEILQEALLELSYLLPQNLTLLS